MRRSLGCPTSSWWAAGSPRVWWRSATAAAANGWSWNPPPPSLTSVSGSGRICSPTERGPRAHLQIWVGAGVGVPQRLDQRLPCLGGRVGVQREPVFGRGLRVPLGAALQVVQVDLIGTEPGVVGGAGRLAGEEIREPAQLAGTLGCGLALLAAAAGRADLLHVPGRVVNSEIGRAS